MSTTSAETRFAALNLDKSPLAPIHGPKQSALVNDLLTRNDKEHDIYFGENHFHNHFPHTLLSQFALGAPEARLRKEWDLEDYLNPLGQKQSPDVTDKNWKEFIGNDKYYPNYLEYFKRKIAEKGVRKTVLDYALDETFLPSFVSGAVHSLIHVGFGLEFNSDIVVAEGLSEGCVHNPLMAPVIDAKLYSGPSTDKKSLLEIAEEIRHDHLFDDVVKFKDFPKSPPVLESKTACDAIKQYVMKWSFEESPAGFAKAQSELFTFTTHELVSSAYPPRHVAEKYKTTEFHALLDFFLMHCLTATYATRVILPYVPEDKRTLLLRVDAAVCLFYYVARGRPIIQPEKIPKTAYTWDQLIEKTWANEDLHVPKVIRALHVIGAQLGEMDEELARNAAGVVVREKIEKGKKWSMYGHGFDEAWDEEAMPKAKA